METNDIRCCPVCGVPFKRKEDCKNLVCYGCGKELVWVDGTHRYIEQREFVKLKQVWA